MALSRLSTFALGLTSYSDLTTDLASPSGNIRAGTDRISRVQNNWVTASIASSFLVRQTINSVWTNNNQDSELLLSTNEVTADGLYSWTFTRAGTNKTQTVYQSGGLRIVTTTAPDSSYTITTNQYGRVISVTRFDANGNQIGQTLYSYDVPGRNRAQTDARNGTTAYTYALAVLFVCFLVARRLINSPFGLALRGIRENAIRMPAIGAPTRAHIRKVYTIAAVMAGVAGALLAQTTETVSLETLSFARSADVLVILILGGAGRLYGGLVGAIIYMVARDQFSGINPQYWYFWIGTLLVAVVIFVPNGILGGAARLVRSGRSRA